MWLILPAVSEPTQMSHHAQAASYYHASSIPAKKPQPNHGHTWSCAPAKSQKYDIFSYLCCRSQTLTDVPSSKICVRLPNFHYPGWETRHATPATQQWPHPHEIGRVRQFFLFWLPFPKHRRCLIIHKLHPTSTLPAFRLRNPSQTVATPGAAPLPSRKSTTFFLIFAAVPRPSQMSHHPKSVPKHQISASPAGKPGRRHHNSGRTRTKSGEYDTFA